MTRSSKAPAQKPAVSRKTNVAWRFGVRLKRGAKTAA
jgi:hypothetical protein